MNVNQKGVIGFSEVTRDLIKKGYECFTPIHDYSAIDLIVLDKYCIARRLQVKYREFTDGKTDVSFTSVVNGKKIPINLDFIDGWAIYLPDVEKICYIDKSMITGKCIGIRQYPGNRKMVNPGKAAVPLYTDFLDETVFWK